MAGGANPTEIDGGEILGSWTKPGRKYKIKKYNFKRPDKFSKEQVRTFQILHEEVARNIEPVLSSLLGEPAHMKITAVDQLTYQELIEPSAAIESYAIVEMKPLPLSAIVQIDPKMAHTIAHRSCGGVGFPEVPDRGLTDTESLIVLDAFESFVTPINDAWSRLVPLDCRMASIESDKQQILIMPGNEMIMLATFSISVGDQTWYLSVTLPYMTLEPIVSRLNARVWFQPPRPKNVTAPAGQMAADLHADTELSIDLGLMQLEALPGIADGDPVEIPGDAPMVLSAGGVELAELETPATLTELPTQLSVNLWENGSASDALIHPKLQDQGSSVSEAIGRALKPVESELRELRASIGALVSAQAIEYPVTDSDEFAGFVPSQIRDVAIILSGETAQTSAFVLAPLDPAFAAGALTSLPEDDQAEVVRRIAMLGDASRPLHKRVVAFISRRTALALERRISGGTANAVNILNQSPRSVEKRVMNDFKETNAELFEQIARRMFVFEDFVLVDGKAIQKLAMQVTPEEFALALKGTAKEVRTHFFVSFEPEYEEKVQRCLDDESPVRLKDVEAMQREIIEELRQLEKAGEVVVARPDELVK